LHGSSGVLHTRGHATHSRRGEASEIAHDADRSTADFRIQLRHDGLLFVEKLALDAIAQAAPLPVISIFIARASSGCVARRT
jgi:hypothetical protein